MIKKIGIEIASFIFGIVGGWGGYHLALFWIAPLGGSIVNIEQISLLTFPALFAALIAQTVVRFLLFRYFRYQ